MSRYDIHIQISGVPGAGKTTLLKLIGHHLAQYGHPVTLRDAGYPSELGPRPMPVEGLVLGQITLSTQRVGDQELEQLLRGSDRTPDFDGIDDEGLAQPPEVLGLAPRVQQRHDIAAYPQPGLLVPLGDQEATAGVQIAEHYREFVGAVFVDKHGQFVRVDALTAHQLLSLALDEAPSMPDAAPSPQGHPQES